MLCSVLDRKPCIAPQMPKFPTLRFTKACTSPKLRVTLITYTMTNTNANCTNLKPNARAGLQLGLLDDRHVC